MDTDQGRLCRYCQQPFQVSCFRPQQKVCSQPECQKQRRADYHRQKRHMDPVYAEVCRDSQQKWRAANPGYQKQYWHSHPAAAERNRQTQRQRDQRRQLHHLVKNNLAQSKLLIFQPSTTPPRLLVKNTQLDLGPPLAV